MNCYYNNQTYSSQEDDNFGMSEEDSYLDNDQMKGGRAVDKESLEYKKRREKNNEAVRRSREKAKVKYIEKEEQIQRLRKENKKLESTAANLRSELRIYQDLASGLEINLSDDPNNANNRMIKVEREQMNY